MLAELLHSAAAEVVSLLAAVPTDDWDRVPGPGVWSIGKDAEHLSEAAVFHQWIVRRTLGLAAPARRPAMERVRLKTELSPRAAAELLDRRTGESVDLILTLSDEDLGRPTRPQRAGNPPLAATIERVLVGHYRVHREAIEAKLRDR